MFDINGMFGGQPPPPSVMRQQTAPQLFGGNGMFTPSGAQPQQGPGMFTPQFTPATLGKPAGMRPNAGATLGRPSGMRTPGTGPRGLGGSVRGGANAVAPKPWEGQLRAPHNSPNMDQTGGVAALAAKQSGGVRPGNNMMGGPSVPPPGQPSLQDIQAQMARRQVGSQLGPKNAALSGYMMG